jgi:predicted O-methyltransferase YrrM
MSLNDFLSENNATLIEGHIDQIPQQVEELVKLSKNSKNIMEIGFNAGHSAEMFLKNNPDLTMTSFDLGQWECVLLGKKYIDKMFPGRHTLIIGDSTISIPKFTRDHPDTRFDLLFIDGGHEYEVAMADIKNCKHLAHKDSIFILDDTHMSEMKADWNLGPNKALVECFNSGLLNDVKCIDFQPGRGMAVGLYNL